MPSRRSSANASCGRIIRIVECKVTFDLGLKKGMFNRIFIGLDGDRYAIRGFNTRSPKYPIKNIRVSNGERRKCGEGFIKELLPEYYINAEMSVMIPDEE